MLCYKHVLLSLTNILPDKTPARSALDLRYVHTVKAEPVQILGEEFGFTWAHESTVDKHRRDNGHDGGSIHHAPHKRDLFQGIGSRLRKLLASGPDEGWSFKEAWQRKRDLSHRIEPGQPEAHDSTPLQPEHYPKDRMLGAQGHQKRDETETEVLGEILDPDGILDNSPSYLEYPRPRQGWVFADTPGKRDGVSNA